MTPAMFVSVHPGIAHIRPLKMVSKDTIVDILAPVLPDIFTFIFRIMNAPVITPAGDEEQKVNAIHLIFHS